MVDPPLLTTDMQPLSSTWQLFMLDKMPTPSQNKSISSHRLKLEDWPSLPSLLPHLPPPPPTAPPPLPRWNWWLECRSLSGTQTKGAPEVLWSASFWRRETSASAVVDCRKAPGSQQSFPSIVFRTDVKSRLTNKKYSRISEAKSPFIDYNKNMIWRWIFPFKLKYRHRSVSTVGHIYTAVLQGCHAM